MRSGFFRNNLISALKPHEFALLEPHMETKHLPAGTILVESGEDVNYAYFPCGPTIVSFVVLLDDARTVETALIGREGAVGGIVSQGRLPAYCRAVVQFPGEALRIHSHRLEEAKNNSVYLRHFFARYADCFLAQIFQSAACNATHTIEQRAAKWLTATIERTGDPVVPLTQDQLAGMLGVGRSYIARVIGNLKAANIIAPSRGKLYVNDFQQLKELACSCNDQVRYHFDTVLAGVYPQDM